MAVLVISVTGCDTFGGGSAPDISQSISSQQDVGIWVEGVGKVSVAPDVAIINMGVQTQTGSVSAAQSQAAQSMSAILSAIKAKGVAEDDIATSNYNISSVYSSDNGKQTLEGYCVTSSMTVKVRDVDKVSDVINAAANAGGNNFRMDSITFSLNHPEQHYESAREAAVKDASERANRLAKLDNVKRGKLIYINEIITCNSHTSEVEIIVNVQAVYAIG